MFKHVTNGSEFYHSFFGGWQPFKAFTQASVGILPGKGPLYYPALGHGLKSSCCIRFSDDLQRIASQLGMGVGGPVLGGQIAAIGKDLLNVSPLIVTLQLPQQQITSPNVC